MPVSVSITITMQGPEEEVFEKIRPLIGARITGHDVPADSTEDPRQSDERLRLFVHSLTPIGREIVETICRASAVGHAVSRTIVVSQVGFPVQQFSGALGAIATFWAATVGGRSPFVGREDRSLGDLAYRIDVALAIRILEMMDES